MTTIGMDSTIRVPEHCFREHAPRRVMDDPAEAVGGRETAFGGLLDALILSDIHLGSDNCQAKAVAGQLERVLDGQMPMRRLIINGDVFDSIDFRRLKKTHWKVLSLIRHLSDKIEVVWICGNHDGSAEIVSHLLGVSVVDDYIFTSGTQRVFCIHGHKFDDFIDDHPVLTWFGDCIYWMLQKLDRSHYIARMAKKKSKVFVHCVDKIETGAMRLAREQGCQIAVCGHTHVAVSKPAENAGEVSYFNSGCWTERPCTYLTVRDGVVRVETDVEEAAAGAEMLVGAKA